MKRGRVRGILSAVTGRSRLEAEIRRLELLTGIGEALAGHADFDESARRVLDVLVPAIADHAVLDVVEHDGRLRRVAVRWSGPERDRVEAAILARGPQPLGVGRTARTGRPQVRVLDDEMLATAAQSAEDLAFLRSLGLRSAVAVPLSSAGTSIGALGLGRTGERKAFSPSDVRFAAVVADRAALALENARLLAALREQQHQLTGILEGIADAVHVHGPDGQAVYANAAAARLVGLPTRDAVVEARPGELSARFDITLEDGTPVRDEDFPGRRIFAGEAAPPPLLARSVDRETGEEMWSLTKATAVPGPDGRPALAVNVIEDVTQSKRAELASRLLAQAGEVLGASLDPDTTLARLAVLAVPRLADWCAVDLPGPDPYQPVELVAVAHVDPEKVELGYELRRRYPVRMDAPGPGLADVLRGGPAFTQGNVEDADLVAFAEDEEHLRLLRAVSFRHLLVVGMRVAGQTVGALTFVRGPGRPAFAPDEIALAEELARRAGTAVLNARLYRARDEVAAALQRALLPRALPEVPGFPMRAHYRPAGLGTDVGGDFYDAFRLPDGWLVVIGDVTGKGAPAAALTGLARSAFEAVATLTGRADLAVGHLNALLARREELALCSVAAVHLRTADQTATIVCAGHPPPLLVRDGEARAAGAAGPLLGALPEGTWPAAEVRLRTGDVLVLRTDGVTDAVGDDGRFGEERLLAALADVPPGRADIALARVRDAVEAHQVGAARDDVALVAIGVQDVGTGTDGEGPRSGIEPAEPPPLAAVAEQLVLDGTASSVARARAAVDRHLAPRLPGRAVSDVRLLVSELASNAVKHAGGEPYVLELDLDALRLRVAIADHGPGFAARDAHGSRLPATTLSEGGYGLGIIERLASRWGVERADRGGTLVTRVWFELDRASR